MLKITLLNLSERIASNGPESFEDSRYPGEGSLYDELFKVEDRHFWFRARNTIIAAALDRAIRSLPDQFRILEIGCGTGNVLRVLEEKAGRGNVIGMDLFAGGFPYAKRRTQCDLVQADMYSPPFNIGFDLIGMFDVIEHLAEDLTALRQARSLLNARGKLLITVPAHMYLWSYADQFAGHYRRYEAQQLTALLESAGFAIDYMTQFMGAAVPFIWFKRKFLTRLSKTRNATEPREQFLAELRVVPILNEFLLWILEQERRFIRSGITLRFGTSLLAIARKP